MRKNWTHSEDDRLRTIVEEVGINDWTTVARRVREGEGNVQRTGKQCRERWYNHLDPTVNKDSWSYEEELLLFAAHKRMGNKWKEISMQLQGRTDNNVKNHFYSTLRRSLRRLNKVIGQKNSTLQMREIKPSVLTIILNFIYDHQDEEEHSTDGLVNQLKGLPSLIFEYAEFKPVKGNMNQTLRASKQEQIETIFRLIQQFKDSYYNEQNGQDQSQPEADISEEPFSSRDSKMHPLAHLVEKSEFKPMPRPVNVLVTAVKEEEDGLRGTSAKVDKFMTEVDNTPNIPPMMELEEPSPLTYIQEPNPHPDLVVIGRRVSPKPHFVEAPQMQIDIDEVLEMNYQ